MNEKATNEDYELILDFVKHAMQEAKSYPLTDDGETDIPWLDFRDWVAGKYASAFCENLNGAVESFSYTPGERGTMTFPNEIFNSLRGMTIWGSMSMLCLLLVYIHFNTITSSFLSPFVACLRH